MISHWGYFLIFSGGYFMGTGCDRVFIRPVRSERIVGIIRIILGFTLAVLGANRPCT